jgi:hypothetical protein
MLLEFTHLATLQNLGSTLDGLEATHHLEAVAGSLQYKEILCLGMLLSPALQLSHGNLVEYFLGESRRRRGAAHDSHGEAIGMAIQTDDSLDSLCLLIHVICPY